ncbi:MAG: hypothetical protein CVU56_12610 [Deltaproteobacteria bacterium HGW-Deltaproteobacteria-14]|jgi:transglutaminase-like putative cysteine protease/tetratricopeptide (TPR) repeat protein|nr:MAG: hypothetical protein CVU56_12610 [Deltaproteobacteria bacterium HGW-Deltaproteobacteria-14]
MNRHGLTATLVMALLGTSGLPPAVAAAKGPSTPDLLATPPLTLPVSELLAIANAVTAPSDEDVEYILDATQDTCDGAGLCTRVERTVFRPLTVRGVDWTDTLSARWKPDYGERPELRARVVTADGRELLLDPKVLSEQPVAASDDVYTDYRKLTAHLPGVAPGVVVETVTTRVERKPAYRSGRLFVYSQDAPHPTRRVVFELSVPSEVPLRWRHVGRTAAKGLAPKESRADGRSTLRIDGAPERRPWPVADTPERPSWSWIVVGTAPSWEAVAGEYADIVAKVLAGPGVSDAVAALAAEIAGDATDPNALVGRVHAWMGAHLHYTGISLGDGAWTPTAPPEVVRRAFGDCKDLATLFVALLRARGVPAEVALVRTARHLDPQPEVPALSWFDHAIVFLPGPTPRWIDPTASHLAPGTLSSSIAGRSALVARTGERGLSPLPPAAASDGWAEVREVRLHRDGPADLVESTLAMGTSAGNLRWWYEGTRADERPGYWMTYAESVYGEVAAARRADLGGYAPVVDPFSISLAIDGLERVALEVGEGEVRVSVGGLLDGLAEALRAPFKEATADDRRWRARWLEREVPLDLGRVERTSVTWRVVLPHGVVVAEEPKLPSGFEVGPVRFSATTSRDGDAVLVQYGLEIRSNQIDAKDVAALHKALVGLGESSVPVLTVKPEVTALLDAGDIGGALRRARALVAEAPDEQVTRRWFVSALIDAGLVDAAKREAHAMSERWPAESFPHALLGYVLLYDGLGRPFAPGWDCVGAQRELRAGLAADPDNLPGHRWLAQALAHDPGAPDGAAPDARVTEALIAELAWLAAHDNHDMAGFYATVLMRSGRAKEAIPVLAAAPASPLRDRVWLSALALSEGVPAALVKHAALGGSPQEMNGRRLWAAGDLATMGAFAAAAELLEGASGSAQQVSAARTVYERLRDAPAPAAGPCTLATPWIARYETGAAERLAEGLPERYRRRLGPDEAAIGWSFGAVRKVLVHDGDVLDRMMVGALACEARPTVGRVTPVQIGVALGDPWPKVRTFAVVIAGAKRGAPAEVVPATPLFLGSEALRALDGERVDEARALIAWAFEVGPTSALTPIMIALDEPWDGSTVGKLDVKRLGLIAAALAPVGPEAKSARARIEAVITGPKASAEVAAAVEGAYVRTLLATGAFEPAVARLDAMAARGVAVKDYCGAALIAISRAKPANAEPLIARVVALGGEDLEVLGRFTRIDLTRGDLAAQRRLHTAAVAASAADTFLGQSARNGLAWLSLYDGGDLEAALALVDEVPERRSPTEHTRATLLAALGRSADAMKALKAAVEARADGMADYDDLVLGRVAQSYGLPELARWYYGRVKAGTDQSDPTTATRTLADRWAAELPAAPDAPVRPARRGPAR